jgi:hypothetical protein
MHEEEIGDAVDSEPLPFSIARTFREYAYVTRIARSIYPTGVGQGNHSERIDRST